MTGMTAVKSREIYQVMGHLVKTNHAGLEFVVVINEALWGEMSDAERAILTAAAAEVEQELRQSYLRVQRETLEWIVANTAMAVHDLDAEQRDAWRAAANPVHEAFLLRAGPVGEALLLEARKFQ